MASYYHQYNDRGNHVNRIEIIDSVASTPTLITTSTGNPIHLRHAGDKDDRKVIKGKELQFSFYCFPGDVDKYDELFESDYKDYKVRFYEDSQLKFEGWLTPENLSREYFRDKYIINLSATDGLAKLKNVEFLDANNSIIEGKLSLLEIIKYAIAKLEIELDFRIQLGTYESALMASTECALKKMSVETRRFVIGNKPIFCSQVIEACLKHFSCTLKQQDGYYQITNIHEGNSYRFVFDWSTLAQQSRTATNKIVDLSGYFYESAELNKISPLREFGIIFRNRDLGEDVTGADLTDWYNNWTITFDSFSVSNGVVELDSGVNYPLDYVEPKFDFNIPYVFPFNSTDYIIVTFDYFIETITTTRPNPTLKISVKRPGGEYSDPLFIYPILDEWISFDSKIHPRLKVLSAGNHNIRILFDHTEDSSPGCFLFYIKNVNISAVSSPGGDPDIDTEVSQDEYYKQTTGKNLVLLEEESQFADGDKVTETGALLHNGTTLTTSWNSYGNSEGIKILDIWARNELNNRYSYKDYLKIIVHDIENNIDIDKILSIGGKYYTFISYQRNHKKAIVTGDLVELLLTHQSYSAINSYALESSEGDSTSSSSAGISSIGVHNYLIGLEGGAESEYYHLSASEHLELSAWLNNVVLSDIGGIDMDDVLLVNTLNEHTAANGILFEGTRARDSYLEFLEIAIPAAPDVTHGRLFVDTADGLIKFRNDTTTFDLTSTVPSAHAASHQNVGGDEINVAGLSGLLADAQTPLAHDLTSVYHTDSGLTIGHFLKATGATTFAFQAHGLTYSDVGAAASSHTHGNITNAGAIGTTTNLPIITTTSGVLIASSFGTAANTFCQGNDARLSNARTPTAHAASHHTGGSDLVNHDSLTGFVANEHINHTSVSIVTGTTSGLNGGGTLAATRTLLLAVDRLTAVTTLQTTDYFPIYDASGAGTRRISYANMLTALNSDLSFGSSDITMDGSTANGVITYGGVDNIDVEANLTFNGSILTIAGKEIINQAVHGTNGLTINYDGPSVTTNTTNNDYGAYIDMRNSYDIATTITDSGSRMGLISAVHVMDATFLGTLTSQYGALIQYGQHTDAGAGTITTAYGLRLQFMDSGSATITNKYSIYSGEADPMMYHAGNVGIGVAPQAGYCKLTVGGSSEFIGSEGGSLDLELNNTHATGTSRLLLACNSEAEFIILHLNYGGDGIFKGTDGGGIWGWDADENMCIGGSVTESTAKLYCFANKVSGYSAHFFNDGNGTNRFGIKISCGTDDQSGTVNYFLKGYAGNKTTEEGGLRNASGTFAVYQGSDRRRKTNIIDTEIDAAGILSSLIVRDYNRIGLKGKLSNKQTGWIAQEVAEIFPAMHGYSKDTDLHSVTPTELIPVLHRGWQLHEEKLETQQQKINRLERHIIQLQTKIKEHETEIKRLG